jgi:hypothetical protein
LPGSCNEPPRSPQRPLCDSSLTIKERSGEVIELALSKLAASEVHPIQLADIQPGSFFGTAAMPQADGRQRAIAVTVFPESARATGRTLQVKYKDGEKTISVPQDAPIVTFKPSDCSLLVVGASVSIFTQAMDGKPTALRVNGGRHGFALPYGGCSAFHSCLRSILLV